MAADGPEQQTYDPTWFDLLDRVEDKHFWFAARRRVVGALARRAVRGRPAGYHVLEIGCGNGGLLPTLQAACAGGRVIGADLHAQGLRHARRRSRVPLVQCDASRPPFGIGFALVGMFDVLEHLPDDAGAMRDVHRLLTPGGALLLTVPAHAWLWSYFDEASNHQRRYAPRGLRARLTDAGFRVAYLSQFMAPLAPIMWLKRRGGSGAGGGGGGGGGSRRDARDELRIVPGVNGAMNALLAIEARFVAARLPVPLGSSLVALAYKDA